MYALVHKVCLVNAVQAASAACLRWGSKQRESVRLGCGWADFVPSSVATHRLDLKFESNANGKSLSLGHQQHDRIYHFYPFGAKIISLASPDSRAKSFIFLGTPRLTARPASLHGGARLGSWRAFVMASHSELRRLRSAETGAPSQGETKAKFWPIFDSSCVKVSAGSTLHFALLLRAGSAS